jgi:hypothetical protein
MKKQFNIGANLSRSAQSKGRAGVFDNYRLRIASVMRDYSIYEREEAPKDSWEVHEG